MPDASPANPAGSLRAFTRACVAAGLCALPAVRRGDEKRAALRSWKPYQSRLPTQDEIASWFGPDTSAVCLVCGAVSGNLEMIDFDQWVGGGGVAFESWRDAVEAASPGLVDRLVVESTPSGGRHVIYRCAEPVSGNTKLAQRRIEAGTDELVVIGSKEYAPRRDAGGAWAVSITLIETRGEGGLFLCAPSEGYAVLQGDLLRPPLLTADERDVLLGCAWALDDLRPPCVRGQAAAVSASPEGADDTERPGDDFNARGDVRDLLRAHGWRLVRSGDNEHWCRPGKEHGTSATLRDGVFYVFSSNADPFEPQKGYAPFAVYALLEHHGDWSAAAAALRARGFGGGDPARAPADGSLCGVDLSGLVGLVHPPAPMPDDPLQPAFVLATDLHEQYPSLRSPILSKLLREGETMNIIAAPKTGKSWLTLDLALAVASGRPWLGRYETAPGEVLIIDNELHRETSASRVPQVARARGLDFSRVGRRVAIDNLRGRLRDIFGLRPYFDRLEPGRFRLVILDAFYRFMPLGGDENDNATMAGIYNAIDAYADRLGCAFVLIHHSTKGNQSGKSVTDVGAGAGSQSRATDTHLVLRPHEEEGCVVLDAAVRSWAPVEPAGLRWSFPVWDFDASLDPAQLRSERPGRKKEPRPPEETRAPPWTVERFVEAFIGSEPATLPELRELVAGVPDLPWRRAGDFIGIAEQRGRISRVRLPGRGGPIGFVRANAPDLGGDA